MTNDDNVVSLCERLRVVESSESSRKPSEWLTFWNRNPDGPEAADLIERQAAELATLTDEIDQIAEQAFAADDRATKAAAEIEKLREVLGELIDYAEECLARLDYHDQGMMGDEPIKEARAVLKGED